MQPTTGQSTTNGILLAVSVTLITAGATMLGAKDLYGLILVAVGYGTIWLREYLKVS